MQCSIEAPKYTYGDLLLAHIKKDERPNKTGPRAYTAIYAGECRKVKGNVIAHPIIPNADRTGWFILGAQSVNQFNWQGFPWAGCSHARSRQQEPTTGQPE